LRGTYPVDSVGIYPVDSVGIQKPCADVDVLRLLGPLMPMPDHIVQRILVDFQQSRLRDHLLWFETLYHQKATDYVSWNKDCFYDRLKHRVENPGGFYPGFTIYAGTSNTADYLRVRWSTQGKCWQLEGGFRNQSQFVSQALQHKSLPTIAFMEELWSNLIGF